MPHNKLIGEILIEMGLASKEVVMDSLNRQTEIHQRGQERIPIGTLMVKTGHLSMEDLEKALEKQMKNRLPS